MKVEKPFDEYSAVFNNTGNGGVAATGDIMLSFVVNVAGDTGHQLPAGSFIKYLLLYGAADQSPVVGIIANDSLLFKEQLVAKDTAATVAPNVWLPEQTNILVAGIAAATRVVIIYKVISLSYA